jgi:hypothetical protein
VSRVAFFPYPTAPDSLELRCKSSTADVEAISATTLYAYETPEEATLEISLELQLPEDLVESLIGDCERDDPPVRPVVTARSIESRCRRMVGLDPVDGEPGLHRGLLELPKREIYGEIRLEPALIRIAPGEDPDYARHLGARLAWGPAVRLVADEPPVPPGAYLEIRWEDFFQSASPRRKRQSGHLYYLDLDSDTPVLWLNERIPDLKAVLQETASRGYVRRVRDTTFDSIASQVWTTLLAKAILAFALCLAGAQEGEEEDPMNALPEWEQRVIGFWSTRIYPDKTRQEALEEIAHAARRPEYLAELMENAASAVQEWLGSAEVFRSTARLVRGEGV